MDLCFVISCHEKAILLLAHLDILSFCSVAHEVIVTHSGPHEVKSMIDAHYLRVSPRGYGLTALLALTAGMRRAKELGFRYICFRNADDWHLNHSRVESILEKMKNGNFKYAGYNWFGKGRFNEFALNDLYIDLDVMSNLDLDAWDNKFINDNRYNGHGVEYKFANMMRSVVNNSKFLRLEGREVFQGVGNTFSPINNNRHFNLDWQLIGDHDEKERRKHWSRVRPLVSYVESLEKKTFFQAWLSNTLLF